LRHGRFAAIGLILLGAAACRRAESPRSGPALTPTPAATSSRDVHSYGNPEEIRVTHADLDWDVDFDRKVLRGSATLTVKRPARGRSTRLVLDTRALDVSKVEASREGSAWTNSPFSLAPPDKILGSALTVTIPEDATQVRITYATRPEASGLQWLDPPQTAGRKNPFLFTQSQAIHARSWIPIQDTPQVRITYEARVRTPPDLAAVMSAGGNPEGRRGGEYRFAMPQRIPAYLFAIAAGDIGFAPMSRRTGVYAEPSVVAAAAREFEDTEKMMQAAERLYGPYRWERYDILVLPPSFPFGGIRNASSLYRIAWTSRLASGSPGTTAGPVSPPLRIPAGSSSRSPPLRDLACAEWH